MNGHIDRITGLDEAITNNTFQIPSSSKARLLVEVSGGKKSVGPDPTVISVKASRHSFSFFLRDISKKHPIFIPDYGVVILSADDKRSFAEVRKDILQQQNRTKLQQIEAEEEASFEISSRTTRDMSVPIWLGITRDMRIFEISEELEDMSIEGKVIRPKYASSEVVLPDSENRAFMYALGRGVGVRNNITRELDEGYMPIYHSKLMDDDVLYHSVSFVSFAETPLTISTNRGTHYMVSDKHSFGRNFREEHEDELERRMNSAYDFENDMVLFCRTTIQNTGSVPRYAWLKTPRPGIGWWTQKMYEYDSETGYSFYSKDRIFCVSKLNEKALPNEELAVLLQPGEKMEYDFFMPHSPVSELKASILKKQSFDQKLEEARDYWKVKRDKAAKINLPEKRIEQMMLAGLFHLDLITYGEEPEGTLSANVGVYSPIGTESAPVILYYLSMGWHDVARRSLNYFMETQRQDGHIQNYQDYESETGSVLWTIGEYIRYTGDFYWLEKNKEKILKSCDYLLRWRNNTYYYTLAAHADRETYTFWEHMYRLSSHKTHEEAWFLMETRWMLYMEEGETLSLFKTIPRSWLENGNTIEMYGVKSYFESLDVSMTADPDQDIIRVSVKCVDPSKPKTIKVRIPHPYNKKPVEVVGGIYDESSETVTVHSFSGEINITAKY